MRMLVNRAKFFALGTSVLMAELLLSVSPVAAASSAVNSPKEAEQCTTEGGTFNLWGGSVEDYESDDEEGEFYGICIIDPTPTDLCRDELKTMSADVDANGECEKTAAPASGNSSGGCFLTTACVGTIGLADDCFELRALRRFRDQTLITMPGGQSDVFRYYQVAPAILSAIAQLPRPERELSRVYVRYILPSVFLSKMGFAGLTRRIYTGMMTDLARRFPVVQQHI